MVDNNNLEPILITGCTGLLGFNFAKKILEKEDRDVFGVALNDEKDELVKELDQYNNFKYFKIDISLEDFTNLFEEINPAIIYHFAAQSQVLDALSNPLTTFETNIKGTWNLLESYRTVLPNSKFIFSSSDKVYGETDELPYLESNQLHSIYPYDVSKISSDLLCQTYKSIYGLDIKIFRSVNIFGPYDLNFHRLIPSILKDIYDNKNPIIRSNGESLREYIYVDQLIEYIELFSGKGNNENQYIYNFGSGNKYKVIDLVDLILKNLNSDLVPDIKNNSQNEISDQYINFSAFAKDYKVNDYGSSFEEDLDKTIKWYFNYLKNI